MIDQLEPRFKQCLTNATDVELEAYIANPAKGSSIFQGCNYPLIHNTNEENELVARARHEIARREKADEDRRWRLTTWPSYFATVLALVIAGFGTFYAKLSSDYAKQSNDLAVKWEDERRASVRPRLGVTDVQVADGRPHIIVTNKGTDPATRVIQTAWWVRGSDGAVSESEGFENAMDVFEDGWFRIRPKARVLDPSHYLVILIAYRDVTTGAPYVLPIYMQVANLSGSEVPQTYELVYADAKEAAQLRQVLKQQIADFETANGVSILK